VLSGGEKVRLAFARLLINPPNFLILDEPTTHLDIVARQTLEGALKDFKGTVCLVSHDIEFVRQVADTIIAMTPPGVTRYWGGYDYYREKLARQEAAADTQAGGAESVSARRASRRARAELVQEFSRRRRELRKQVNRVESRIERLEAEQAELVEQLSAGESGHDYAGLNKRLADLQRQLSDANLRWEAFAIELDELEREYNARR
jgi:ATP-binding cassette subfamily F protein 3